MNPRTRRQRRQNRKWFQGRSSIVVRKLRGLSTCSWLEPMSEDRMRRISVPKSRLDDCWIWRTRAEKRHNK